MHFHFYSILLCTIPTWIFSAELKRLSKKELKRDLEQKQATLGLEKMAIQQMNNLLQELERLEVEVRRYWVWSRKDLLVRGIENTLYAFEQLNCSTPREPRQQQHRRGYQVWEMSASTSINRVCMVTAPSMSPAVRVSHAEHDQRGLVTCVPPPNARTSIMNSYQ